MFVVGICIYFPDATQTVIALMALQQQQRKYIHRDG
jgi:hypothetical protein